MLDSLLRCATFFKTAFLPNEQIFTYILLFKKKKIPRRINESIVSHLNWAITNRIEEKHQQTWNKYDLFGQNQCYFCKEKPHLKFCIQLIHGRSQQPHRQEQSSCQSCLTMPKGFLKCSLPFLECFCRIDYAATEQQGKSWNRQIIAEKLEKK